MLISFSFINYYIQILYLAALKIDNYTDICMLIDKKNKQVYPRYVFRDTTYTQWATST